MKVFNVAFHRLRSLPPILLHSRVSVQSISSLQRTFCQKQFNYTTSTMSKPEIKNMEEEARWAIQQAKTTGLIGEEDTSVLFHSFDSHHKYLSHLKAAFSAHPNAIHAVAIKTNPHPAILKKVAEWGFGLEAASMEEVQLAINAGCPPSRIVFDSPVKTKLEIKTCNEQMKGLILNVNSMEELRRIPSDHNFTLGLRINPLVDTGAPDMFHVSSNESKFGVPLTEKVSIMDAIRDNPITQLHVHSGTAMNNLDSAVEAIKSIVDVAVEANIMLKEAGITDRKIGSIDIGGGLRPEILDDIDLVNDKSRMEKYAIALQNACPQLFTDFDLVTEFGQWSYFHSGYAYSTIEYAIQRKTNRVVYVHLGADFLMRDAYSKPRGLEFIPVSSSDGEDMEGREKVRTDIAGPLCFAGDYLEKSLLLPKLEEGDEMILLNTGSNAFGLWSRHCSRTIPMVVGVKEGREELVVMSPRNNPFMG